MEPAKSGDPGGAGPEHQVVGVGQHDLGLGTGEVVTVQPP